MVEVVVVLVLVVVAVTLFCEVVVVVLVVVVVAGSRASIQLTTSPRIHWLEDWSWTGVCGCHPGTCWWWVGSTPG